MSSALVVAIYAATTPATTGCSSSSDEATSDPAQEDRDKAHDYYITRVHNAIGTCVNCHAGASGPRFMAADAEESYATLEKTVGLIAAPKTSPLVQYVHKDPKIVIEPAQRSVLSQWLSLEANARSLEGAVAKPKTVTEAYKQFADCMNFDVWSYYRMGDLAFAQTDSEGPCQGCHSTGQGSAWLSAGSRETFEKAKSFPYIQKLVVGKLDAKGSFESLQASRRFAAKAEEICPPESTSCHPRFGLPPIILDSIDNFVDTTIQNLATGTCANGIVVPVDAGGSIIDAGSDGGVKK